MIHFAQAEQGWSTPLSVFFVGVEGVVYIDAGSGPSGGKTSGD